MMISLSFSVQSALAAQNPVLVALFGDSISLGYNQACPSRELGDGRLNFGQPSIQLSSILNGSGRTSLVANLGAGGTPSGTPGTPLLAGFNNGLSRITPNLAQVTNLHGPNSAKIAVILYGTNDYAYSISATTTGFNIEQLIDRAITAGFIPVVGTIPPCACNNVVPVNNRIKLAVSNKLGQGREVYLVDQYAMLLPTWLSLVDPDGVHPNDAGYRVMAENWFNASLASLIEPNRIVIAPILLLLQD